MQIVIDIPEDAYNYIKANGARIPYYKLTDAIKNGTPLPKGHGRWIDGKCNRCGTHAPFWSMASTYYCSNYCPHCGAKMAESEERDADSN